MSEADAEELVRKFQSLERTEVFSLLDRNGVNTVLVAKAALLHCCPYFENRLNEQPDLCEIRTSTTREVLKIFRAYLQKEEYGEIPNAYDAMVFACTIQCDDFVQYCAQSATGIVMPDTASKEAITVIREIVRFLPLRTFDNYLTLLQLARTAQDNQALVETVKSVLKNKDEYAYKPLPLPLFTNRVTAAFMFDCEGNKVTVCLRDNKWVPVDLFGPRFSPFDEDAKNFYLCFNNYVIYEKSEGPIMRRNLHSDEPPQQLFDNCKYFVSCCNSLYIVRESEPHNVHAIYKWDPVSLTFVQKFANRACSIAAACGTREGYLQLQLESQSRVTSDVGSSSQTTVVKMSSDDCLYTASVCTKDFSRCKECSAEALNEDASFINYNGTWTSLAQRLHIGYTILQTNTVSSNVQLYETIIHTKAPGCGFTSVKSQLHGKVIAWSDVLVV